MTKNQHIHEYINIMSELSSIKNLEPSQYADYIVDSIASLALDYVHYADPDQDIAFADTLQSTYDYLNSLY